MSRQEAGGPRGQARHAGARPGRSLSIRLVTALIAAGGSLVTAALATSPGTAAVAATPGTAATSGSSSALGYDPQDTGSMSAISRIIGAQDAWARGYTGRGIDVALIDTGVARVPGLDGPNTVIDGPDLSFDAPGSPSPGVDAYGHGTFMAGLIAGRDAGAASSGFSDTTKFVGIAPEARIINVKVGAADGATDVSQVIAAVDWVTQHAHDPGLNIRVLNLSFGVDTLVQGYRNDPLAHAVEQAWAHGIVVVAAAGNDGRVALRLANPAFDPFILAVGGDDPLGTLSTSNDRVPRFAQHGLPDRPVDVIAPATHVIGLRVPGSFIDSDAGNTGRVGSRFQRGSGTSQASAITAGAAALLLQQHPNATPDAVKALLNSTATPLPPSSLLSLGAKHYSGHGIVNVAAAINGAPTAAPQVFATATGGGSLRLTRGGAYVSSNGLSLTAESDIFGVPFDTVAMARRELMGSAWSGGEWNGSRWSGDDWNGSRWSTTLWSGTDWAGNSWHGSRWSGMSWNGSRWSGDGWKGSRWTGANWSMANWSTAGWD